MNTKDDLIEKFVDVSGDGIDFLVQHELENGILKDLPFLGTAVKIALLGKSISDLIFIKKIGKFLFHLSKTTEKERAQFYSKIKNDPEVKEKVGDNLLLLIQNTTRIEKLDLFAKLFSAYLLEKIDYYSLSRLLHAVEIASYEDLRVFILSRGEKADYFENLLPSGLIIITRSSIFVGNGLSYNPMQISELGKELLEIIKST